MLTHINALVFSNVPAHIGLRVEPSKLSGETWSNMIFSSKIHAGLELKNENKGILYLGQQNHKTKTMHKKTLTQREQQYTINKKQKAPFFERRVIKSSV